MRLHGHDHATHCNNLNPMPTKKATAVKVMRRSRRAAPKESPAAVRVSLEPAIDALPIYSNHIEVGHGRHEFTMLVGRVPVKLPAARLEAAAGSGQLDLDPEAVIVLPPTLLPGLIKALQTQLEKWEKKFGPLPTKESSA